jgi:hypothetical protein
MESLDVYSEYHTLTDPLAVAPLTYKSMDEYREPEVSSIESDSLDELAAIREKLDQIMKELKEIKESLRKMEEPTCVML